MIFIKNVITPSSQEVEFVIEGMRNPMNSWENSDSMYRFDILGGDYNIGPNDKKRMTSLVAAGTDHRKFLRMLPLYMRITAPMYWWKEFDTYKIGTVRNSTSTMHKITAKEFDISDFSTDHLFGELSYAHTTIESIIDTLNLYRMDYLAATDEDIKKEMWYQIIQLLPSSYNQTSNVMMNYEIARRIYHARKGHKLDEWHTFCDILEKVPMEYLITMEEGK